MKKLVVILLTLVIAGCSSLTPQETNVAVGQLPQDIQLAINIIDARSKAKGSNIPPFKKAEITLATQVVKAGSAEASLFIAAGGERESTKSNTLTLELVRTPLTIKSLDNRGLEIADYIMAAVMAVNKQQGLKLQALTFEAEIEVTKTAEGGLEIELAGVSLGRHRLMPTV